jgi:hypothetical protein
MEARTDPYDPTTDSIDADRNQVLVTVFKRIERDVREFEFVVGNIESYHVNHWTRRPD